MSHFRLSILAADRNFYVGDCESLIVPTSEGMYGILAHHSNMISAVCPGELSYRIPGEAMRTASVSEGIVKVEDNEVLILVGTAEHPEEIDANRAQRRADAAREAMLQKRNIAEYRAAQAQLTRAMSRLRIRNNYDSKNPLR